MVHYACKRCANDTLRAAAPATSCFWLCKAARTLSDTGQHSSQSFLQELPGTRRALTQLALPVPCSACRMSGVFCVQDDSV